MALSDFDNLLRDLRTAFGSNAYLPGVARPIPGRFRIDPFLVPLSPSESGLRVTETWFFYDARRDLPPGVLPPQQGDQLVINGTAYEIADIERDDLGEHGLQLLRANDRPVVWDNGATVWDNGATVWR